MRAQEFIENMNHSKDGQAVEELKAALIARKQQLQSGSDDQVYDTIDKIMTRIAKTHSISGQKLHDMWVDKYDQIPDTWIMKENFADGKKPGKPVVDAIQKVLPVAQEIWFHGSRATGKHRKNSDTDILVTVPDDLVGDQYLAVVRILQKLSAHFDNYDIQPTKSGTNIHRIAQEEGQLLWSTTNENFADGKKPGRKGLAKRSGVNCKQSVSKLRSIAANSSGERQRMAHWCANMKAGRKK
jgi:predicted nucleotidyltransferase